MEPEMIGRKALRWLALLATTAAALGGGYYVKASGALAPGPLSAQSLDGETTGGFVSHAEFEQDCGHCHAPVHCLEEDRCTECHQDVAEQRAAAEGLHGRLPASRCQTCHTEHKGRDATITEFAFANVDHMAMAGFSLAQHPVDYQGNHLHCDACHSQAQYMDASLDCVTCHMDENASYIAGHMQTYGPNCIECHDGMDRMLAFDHNTVYALEGAHAGAACEACHSGQTYIGTTAVCADCHEDPAVHAGSFGADCGRCHDAAAWSPAQLTQHTFELNHGADENRPCAECHPVSYSGYSCTTCHDHEPQQMFEVHAEYQISEYGNCASCHPTGIANEAAIPSQTTKQWSPQQNSPASDGPKPHGDNGNSSPGEGSAGDNGRDPAGGNGPGK
jgi:hypothetical protein